MIDRLRAFLNRPLRDADRRRLFVAAVAVILAGAGALALLDGPPPHSASGTPLLARSAPRRPPWSSPPRTPRDRYAQRGGRTPPRARGLPRRRRRHQASGAAIPRRLPPLHLRPARARRIAAASAQLRRRLAAQPPRVPARERRRHPRVVLVQSNGVGRGRAELVALVRDGARRYTVPLELTRGRAAGRSPPSGADGGAPPSLPPPLPAAASRRPRSPRSLSCSACSCWS